MSSSRNLWLYQCMWDGCSKVSKSKQAKNNSYAPSFCDYVLILGPLQSFNSVSTFEAHYRSHTNQPPYACDCRSCSEAFHDLETLNQHRRTHADDLSFACKYESCSQAFHNHEALYQHYHTHTDQRTYTCRYDSCGQTFRDRGELIEHHRTHKQRPLACEYDSCNRTFARRETLEAHMHMHTKERLFTCPYEGCSRSFCEREGLIWHESSHENKDLHRCRYEPCNETFQESSQLHRHYREEHDKTTTPVEEVRPIRLRLTQPTKQNPKSSEDISRKRILLPLPKKKTLGGLSTPDPTEGSKDCSESNNFAQPSIKDTGKKKVHEDAHTSSSTSEASGNVQVSSHGSIYQPPAIPLTPKLNSRPQASVLQPAAYSTSVEPNSYTSCTNGESIWYGTFVNTSVCGVYSSEKAPPNKDTSRAGRYHCPRCDSEFTRPRGVRRHFVGCIRRYGNPDSLKWTSHESLWKTARYYARHGYQDHENLLPLTMDVSKELRELPNDALLRPLAPKPLSSIVEENTGSVKPVYNPPERDALVHKNIVRPIQRRRDALRRSKYNSETIARDILLATGSHPTMDALNSHLDIIRKNFRAVNLESNMSTFMWDLVDYKQDSEKKTEREPGQVHEHKPKRQIKRGVEPENSASTAREAKKIKLNHKLKDVQRSNNLPISFPSRLSIKPVVLNDEVSFQVIMPNRDHFGTMSKIFSTVIDRDLSARFMSRNEELWASVFTMLECGYQRANCTIQAVVRKDTSEIIGWMACHEVDTFQAKPEHPSAYLDWFTAAQLLPSQLSRFTPNEESAKEKAERSEQRKVGQDLASIIQARATRAQDYCVPIRRLVVNALVVHPLYQGRGIASALLKPITETMDVEKRPIWIQAPEDPAVAQGVLKAGLFRRADFICAGEQNLDLDLHVSKPGKSGKEKGISFGTYKWNYMLRWPHPVGQKPPQRQ